MRTQTSIMKSLILKENEAISYESFKGQVFNIIEMLNEENDEDVFAGTEDSYVFEVATQNLFDVLYYAFIPKYDGIEKSIMDSKAADIANDVTNDIIDAVLDGRLSYEDDTFLRDVYKAHVNENMNEAEDHLSKKEDYTQASNKFDDIFSNGDYITSAKGHKVVYNIYDGNIHQINVSNPYDSNEDYYSAQSKDGLNWIIFGKRNIYPYNRKINVPEEEIQGEPMEIAKHIAELNDKFDKRIDKS